MLKQVVFSILFVCFVGFSLLISTMNFNRVTAESLTASSFKDISGHWAEVSINEAVQTGFVEGYPDGTFKPDDKVTRAEFIKMVITALGIVQGQINPGAHWYDNYVNAATASNMYKNDFSDDFNKAMTRQEMALISLRACNEEISNKADYEADRIMYDATKTGVIKGMDNTGTLGGDQMTTRAQSITVIERILKVKAGEQLPVDKHAVNRAEVIWHNTNIFTVIPEIFNKIQYDNIMPIDVWDKNNLFVETENDLFKAELESLIAIDLSDKNDPNWNLVPANLKWNNYPNVYDVRDYPNSYLILPISHPIYNKNKKIYLGNDLLFDISGFSVPANFNTIPKDQLVRIGMLTLDGKRLYPGYILPKNNKNIKSEINIHINAPGFNTNDVAQKTILRVVQ